MTLPNLISLGRLLAVPLIVWLLLVEEWTAAFGLFVLAGLSDAVDGFIAKRFGAQSRLGRFLDPIADKTLLVSIYITLGVQGHVPTWLVILVVSRDTMIIGGALMLYIMNLRVDSAPLLISKVNTALQIALAALALAGLAFAFEGWIGLVDLMVLAVAATTVASGAAYLVNWGRSMAGMEDAP